jgi:PadR family transcriptional regulator, regulatory protein PadR
MATGSSPGSGLAAATSFGLRDGLVKSRWTAASGRRRRVYRITRSGREALAVRRLEWKQFSRAVEAVLA